MLYQLVPPQNLIVNIELSELLSNTVNVTASADYALYFEVDFGDINRAANDSNRELAQCSDSHGGLTE